MVLKKRYLLAVLILPLAIGAALGWWRFAATFKRFSESDLPQLPAYGLEMSTDPALQNRGLTSVRVTPGSLLTLVLRPAENVVGPINARAFLSSNGALGGRWQPWAVHLDRADSGAFALRARVRDLPGLAPGRWQVAFLVGRPSSLPSEPGGVKRGEAHAGWHLLEGEIEMEDTGVVENSP